MKKRYLFTLILGLLLCLLISAAAADTPIMMTDGSQTTLEAYIEGKPMIIAFGRTTCGNTRAFLQKASSNADEFARNGIGVIALMDTSQNDPTPQELTEFASNYPGVIIAKELGSVPFWSWLSQIGESTSSVTYPVVFVRDAEGKLLDGSTGYYTKDFDKAIQLLTGKYVPASYTLTVHFLSIYDNTEIAPAFVGTYQEGTIYNITAPTVDGYTRDDYEISGKMPEKDLSINIYYDSIENPYPDPVINLTVDKETIKLNESFHFSCEILYTNGLNEPFGVWKIYELIDGDGPLVDYDTFDNPLSCEGSYTLTDPDVEKVILQVLLGDADSDYAIIYKEQEIIVDHSDPSAPTEIPTTPTPTPTPSPSDAPTPTPGPTANPTSNPTSKPDSTPTPEPEPADKVEAFITRCYSIILGRKPDAGGLQTWYNELTSGRKTASEIIDRFVNSKEFVDKQYTDGESVDILYRAMLGRNADAAGKANWVLKLQSGQTLAHVINGFCFSKEFRDLCDSYGIKAGFVNIPNTDTTAEGKIKAFVQRCYRIILDREADPSGMQTWYEQLSSGKKAAAEIIDRFVNSPEFSGKNYNSSDSVEILYKAMLGRGSDAAGKANWVGKLDAGQPFAVVINGFCVSKEFTGICASYGIKPGSVTITPLSGVAEEEALSMLAYKAKEPITKKSETNPTRVEIINPSDTIDMNIGTAVQAVYINEEKAREFISRCYRCILGREASAAELNNWIGQMTNGTKTPDQIARGFLFSNEFKGRNVGNEDLVKILYKVYMNRDADPEGLATWTEKLNNGTSLNDLLDVFAKTSEFKKVVSEMSK